MASPFFFLFYVPYATLPNQREEAQKIVLDRKMCLPSLNSISNGHSRALETRLEENDELLGSGES